MAEYNDVADELEAMIRGDFDAEVDDANKEDTDSVEDETLDTETNDEAAELDDDTVDGVEDDQGENTPEDDDDSDELDDANAEEDEGEIEDTDGEDEDLGDEGEDDGAEDDEGESSTDGEEDDTDTEATTDGVEAETTDDVDYQKQYEELLASSKEAVDFFGKVAGVKFKANGKEVEGFKDPEKIIQAQQLAYNYSAKMAGFKQYRPFMQPLKDRGILDNPEKFDMAMSIIDGDTEALKRFIADSDIDPLDLDMEDIKYESAPMRTSADMIAIEDAMDNAKNAGVDKQVYEAVVKEWDNESFQEFVDSPAVQKDLIEHVANGSYEVVMNKVEQLSVLDAQYANQKMTDKYRQAVQELNAVAPENAQTPVTEVPAEDPLAAERAALEAERVALAAEADKVKQERAIMASRKKNEAAKKARLKGASVSKTKTNVSRKKKVIDPMSLDGQGMSSLLDSMIMGSNK